MQSAIVARVQSVECRVLVDGDGDEKVITCTLEKSSTVFSLNTAGFLNYLTFWDQTRGPCACRTDIRRMGTLCDGSPCQLSQTLAVEVCPRRCTRSACPAPGTMELSRSHSPAVVVLAVVVSVGRRSPSHVHDEVPSTSHPWVALHLTLCYHFVGLHCC